MKFETNSSFVVKKIDRVPVIKAQIKLKFRGPRGRDMVCSRSFQVFFSSCYPSPYFLICCSVSSHKKEIKHHNTKHQTKLCKLWTKMAMFVLLL